jgi:hypothetical protein
VTARNVHRARDVPRLELVLLAHVDQRHSFLCAAVLLAQVQLLLDLGRIDFLDPRANLLDQLLSGAAPACLARHVNSSNFD